MIETIYVAPGETRCRVYAIPYPMRPGQHPRDIGYRYQQDWREIAMLNRRLEIVYLDPAYADIADDIVGCMGGTFFERDDSTSILLRAHKSTPKE